MDEYVRAHGPGGQKLSDLASKRRSVTPSDLPSNHLSRMHKLGSVTPMSGAAYSQMSGAKSATPFSGSRTAGLKHHAQDIDYTYVDLDESFDFDTEPDEAVSSLKPIYDRSGKAVYIDACKRFNIVPVSYFLRHLNDKKLVLKHHYLGDLGVRALCVTLMSNATIVELNISDNWIGASGGRAIWDMLRENCFITVLDVSNNPLTSTPSTMMAFSEALKNNTQIVELNISGTLLDDSACVYLADVLVNNIRLETLDVSHNRISEKGAALLAPTIAENAYLKTLDLSWNFIRGKGAKALVDGIAKNVMLKKVNLSWNGLGHKITAQELGKALRVNNVLEELDITCNRFTPESAVFISRGLAVNETLRVLKMGKNPMRSAGCYAICTGLMRNVNTQIRMLDFSDILLNNDFHDLFKQLKERIPDLQMTHGGQMVSMITRARTSKPRLLGDPLARIKQYMDSRNMRVIDLFSRADKDQSNTVTRNEFVDVLREIEVEMTEDEVDQLIKRFDKDGEGTINYNEMATEMQKFTEMTAKERILLETISKMPNSPIRGLTIG